MADTLEALPITFYSGRLWEKLISASASLPMAKSTSFHLYLKVREDGSHPWKLLLPLPTTTIYIITPNDGRKSHTQSMLYGLDRLWFIYCHKYSHCSFHPFLQNPTNYMKLYDSNLADKYTGPSHSLGLSKNEQINEHLTQCILWLIFFSPLLTT